MKEQFSRSELLLGEKINILKDKNVIVFGIGGVGGYVAESLLRTGVGHISFVDNDIVSESNINRQIIALHSTIGQKKVDVMKNRGLDINPSADITVFPVFYNEDTKDLFQFENYDYIIDAIDSVPSKILLAEEAKKHNIPIISAMGAGNKLDPSKFEVTDIFKTSVCPLARVMRHELRKRNINSLKVVYSTEKAVQTNPQSDGSHTPGSLPYVTGTAGFIIAGEVIKDLISD